MGQLFDTDIKYAKEVMFIYLLNPGCKTIRRPTPKHRRTKHYRVRAKRIKFTKKN